MYISYITLNVISDYYEVIYTNIIYYIYIIYATTTKTGFMYVSYILNLTVYLYIAINLVN